MMFTSRHGSATRDEFWRITAMMIVIVVFCAIVIFGAIYAFGTM